MRRFVRSTTMRRTLLRAIALVGAVTGLVFVVAHAGMTVGCNRGNTPESQAPVLNNASATAGDPAAATATTGPNGPSAAPATPAKPRTVPSPAKAKDRMRYLPATKAAPVFLPNDAFEDDDPSPPPQQAPQPQQQNAAPQQNRKGGR